MGEAFEFGFRKCSLWQFAHYTWRIIKISPVKQEQFRWKRTFR